MNKQEVIKFIEEIGKINVEITKQRTKIKILHEKINEIKSKEMSEMMKKMFK